MVVKMRKWSPWIAAPPAAATASRKFQVKIKPLKLEAIEEGEYEEKKQRVVSIKVKWKGEPRFRLMPFYKHKKDFSKEKIVEKGEVIEWDDDDDHQMVHTCSFTMVPNQEKKFVPWDASFNILYVSFDNLLLCFLHVFHCLKPNCWPVLSNLPSQTCYQRYVMVPPPSFPSFGNLITF